MTWRPIEDAPRDGTVVDLWIKFPPPSDRGYRQTAAKWQERGCSTTTGWQSYGWSWVAEHEIQGNPSHWMLPPEPPEPPK